MTTIRHIISYIFLVLFPLFEAASYGHLYWQRNDILTRKRNVSTVYLATLAGWLAYFNLVVSLFEGVPCGVVYVASLLVAPISVGPQLVRALTLRGTIQHSQLVIEDEISSREHRQHHKQGNGRLSTVHDVEEGPSLPALVASSEKKIEADLIMAKTRRIVKITKLALLAVPTILLVLTWTLSLGSDQLLATDFSLCQTKPTAFNVATILFGVTGTILALVGIILLKKIDDELQIAVEIRRNSVILGCSYVLILIVVSSGHNEWQPLLQTIAQMVLSFSMAIVPFLPPGSTLNNFASWAKQQGKRINPATKSAVPGYARPLPRATRPSTRTSIQSVMTGRPGRRQSLSIIQKNDHRHREMSVSWDAGLCVLLSTQDGINAFSQHCAREFSSENVRFWCAVNDYRAMFDKKSFAPSSSEDDDGEDEEDIESTPETQMDNTNMVAKGIYRLFIDQDSTTQVNLSSKMRSDLQKAFGEGHFERNTFDKAQREIFSVMSRDSYPRFLASKKSRMTVI